MPEALIWVSVGLWTIFFLHLIVNRFFIRPLPKLALAGEPPLVSIVVPARNEERGIRKAVSSFCEQDYPRLEVIVVDDCSTDATPGILKELQAKHPRLKVVQGKPPPKGWLGKPNALETGRKTAKGDWFLFADADVVYAPDLVSRSVAYVLKEKAAMLCLWPNMIFGGLGEALVLSKILHFFVLSPAFLVSKSRLKFVAAGGGVFNMVRRDALETCGAFACLKDAVIDDIGLGYKVKGAGFPLAVALSKDLIGIRMYYGFRETLDGLNKNAYPTLRARPLLLLLIPPLGFTIFWLPYLAFIWGLTQGALNPPATI
ncbi:MAG: glycosyltransferase, partial [Elusimicrobiota bacterium]